MAIPARRPRPPLSIPGSLVAQAGLASLEAAWAQVWRGSFLHRLTLAFPAPRGLAARPHDLRPTNPEAGRQRLAGRWIFHGEVMDLPKGGDPWDRASPSRRHAGAFHSFEWTGDLLAHGEEGAREVLRLALEWRRLFGRWNDFSWAGRTLERRVFNWACALPHLAAASEAELGSLTLDLARQARCLLGDGGSDDRKMDRAAAAAVAGVTLGGSGGEGILTTALGRLERGLARAVLADGGHASRSPERALELLLDLLTLDDGLSQRGRLAPTEVSRAIDRLFSAVRMFTLGDGRLACVQGGAEGRAASIAAALAVDDGVGRRLSSLPDSGYQRLEAGGLQVFVDAGIPAKGRWSQAAVAQPLALEIVAGGHRLITQVGWTPDVEAPGALRLAEGGSTVSLGETSAGAPLGGALAQALGARLVGGPNLVWAERAEATQGVLLDLGHDGWLDRFGLWHQRTLFLSPEGELRGEDVFAPLKTGDVKGPRRYVAFTVRFHLYPGVSASVARDSRSVLLRAGMDPGWRLRNDATDVQIETSRHFRNGEERRTSQIVLKGQVRIDIGGRVRWKLEPAET